MCIIESMCDSAYIATYLVKGSITPLLTLYIFISTSHSELDDSLKGSFFKFWFIFGSFSIFVLFLGF